jgi:hypothetical protein
MGSFCNVQGAITVVHIFINHCEQISNFPGAAAANILHYFFAQNTKHLLQNGSKLKVQLRK